MFVIGTAGHVDHGKSTLVKALTGIDPDRLPEEKAREMTIDLGFAWLTLPSGREVSVVDVPGHERFIKNMLAGVGGIDVALLIVAADEGVMQQTREHLAILDLLQVDRGIVVITKRDLVDGDWLELVTADVQAALKGTTLEKAPIVAVSAYTGQGLDELKALLDKTLDASQPRKDLGRPRLPVDRIFTVAGFGTVVTGTLIDGALSVGQEVVLAPGEKRGRIRGLQSHRKKLERAEPGNRVAVNLSGLVMEDVRRGDVLTTPGWLEPTGLIDASIRVIRGAPRALKHNETLTFHAFASEAFARVRLLERDELAPGEEGLAQLHLFTRVPVLKGDYFVVRSADATLGGGRVVDPHPRRHRRGHEETLQKLRTMGEGGSTEVALEALAVMSPASPADIARKANLSPEETAAALKELVEGGEAVELGGGDPVYYTSDAWSDIERRLKESLEAHHREHPLRRGMPREEVRSRLGLSNSLAPRVFARLARKNERTASGPAGAGLMVEEDAFIRLPSHQPTLTAEQSRQADEYVRALEAGGASPPTDVRIDSELLAHLVDTGRVVKVAEDLVFGAAAYKQMVERTVELARKQGKITVQDVRALFDSSRKYVLPFLEYLDSQRVTRRVGDERVLR